MHNLTYSTGNSLMGNAESKWYNVMRRKSKALPCGRIRFHSVWSELKDLGAPSLLREFGFSVGAAEKNVEFWKITSIFWSALNSGHCSSATHLSWVCNVFLGKRKVHLIQWETDGLSVQPQCTQVSFICWLFLCFHLRIWKNLKYELNGMGI